MKNNVNSIVFGVAIIIASVILGNAYLKRSEIQGEISVTGLGEENFESDLITWSASFSNMNLDLKQASSGLKSNRKLISEYIVSKGISEDLIIFSSVNMDKKTRSVYSSEGEFMGSEFMGYNLSQSVSLESSELDKVTTISREITELLNRGVQINSHAPEYYYTKLADLKIEMISKATENARIRAEMIALNSGSNLGRLTIGKMGIFQITGQNSSESYSWGGALNTSSRYKRATITMKLTYEVD